MMPSGSAKHDPAHAKERASATLASVRTLYALGRWWEEELSTMVRHDFSVMGKTPRGRIDVQAADIVLFRGPLQAERDVLLGYCSSLLGVWRVMRQAAILDLGPCGCVGQYAIKSTNGIRRTFLVHATDAEDGNLVFVILTAEQWLCPEHAKTTIGQLMPDIAKCVAHIPERVVAPVRRDSPEVPAPSTTPRERDIGRLVREGLTNKEIARQLNLSPNTVRNQISHLTRKLGARNRAQLALMMPP